MTHPHSEPVVRSANGAAAQARFGGMVALLAGLTIVTVLIAYHGLGTIGDVVVRGSEALVPLLALQVFRIVLAGRAWSLLLGRDGRGRGAAVLVYRWIRNSVNALLPVGRVGGDVIGARLLMLAGAPGELAAASVLADKTLEVCGLLVLAWSGLLLAVVFGYEDAVVTWVAIGLTVFSGMVGGFVVAQRSALLGIAENFLAKLAAATKARLPVRVGATRVTLLAIYANRRCVVLGLLLHVASWFASAVAIWLALIAMGHPIDFAHALVLEGLARAIASAGFLMPASLGVQEAGYVVIGTVVGLPAEVGLALSLMRRGVDLLLGVPGLVCWQAIEARRLLTRGSLSSSPLGTPPCRATCAPNTISD